MTIQTIQTIHITGIILASGDGSRLQGVSQSLGLPKHLFPIGNTNIINRLVAELSLSCDEIICVINEKYQEQFVDNFKLFSPTAPTAPTAPTTPPAICKNIKVVCKEHPGFYGDFAASKFASHDNIILTIGDLIYPEGEVTNFVKRAKNKKNQAIICLDCGQLKKMDLRIIMAAYPKKLIEKVLPLNPESLLSMSKAFFQNVFKGDVSLALAKTLFNVNTEESFLAAQEYFRDV